MITFFKECWQAIVITCKVYIVFISFLISLPGYLININYVSGYIKALSYNDETALEEYYNKANFFNINSPIGLIAFDDMPVYTVFQYTCSSRQDIAIKLLDKGADINGLYMYKDYENSTWNSRGSYSPLHLAMDSYGVDGLKLAEELLNRGAKIVDNEKLLSKCIKHYSKSEDKEEADELKLKLFIRILDKSDVDKIDLDSLFCKAVKEEEYDIANYLYDNYYINVEDTEENQDSLNYLHQLEENDR